LLNGYIHVAAFSRSDANFVVGLTPSQSRSQVQFRAREQRIIQSLVLGRSQKQIGYEVELSAAAVSGAIQRILRKLGLARWEHLVAVACALERQERVSLKSATQAVLAGACLEVQAMACPAVLSRLTAAERDIALHVVEGCSNAQIACLRDTSTRTIANQISSLFRKLEVQGRLELILRLLVE
jgi:DNA-binding NarL/FixJ family response regulator